MNPADRFSIELSDLRTLADMAVDRVHDNLSLAVDVNGRAAVVVHPTAAAEMHLLCREVARRIDELQSQANGGAE